MSSKDDGMINSDKEVYWQKRNTETTEKDMWDMFFSVVSELLLRLWQQCRDINTEEQAYRAGTSEIKEKII